MKNIKADMIFPSLRVIGSNMKNNYTMKNLTPTQIVSELDDFIKKMTNTLQTSVLKVGLHGRKRSPRLKALLAREKITGKN